MIIICRQCGKEFTFPKSEQEFYEQKGFTVPLYCRECRSNRRNRSALLCSGCGTQLSGESAVYCTACLAADHLEFELEMRKLKASLDEANKKLTAKEFEKAQSVDKVNKKLNVAEAEKARLSELLQHEKRLTADLQQKFDSTRFELKKALKYHATLDLFEQALNYIKDRVEVLERNQNDLSQTMLHFTQEVSKIHENGSLLEVFKRIVLPHRKSQAPSR